MAKANLQKAQKRYKDFVNKSRREMNFKQGDEMWLNIKNFWLWEGLSHKFLGPCVGPFKMLENKFPDIYKLELLENLKVLPYFMSCFWSRSPVMPQGLIESITHGLHLTLSIINLSSKWRLCSSQGN
jgi:hypothetical protein